MKDRRRGRTQLAGTLQPILPSARSGRTIRRRSRRLHAECDDRLRSPENPAREIKAASTARFETSRDPSRPRIVLQRNSYGCFPGFAKLCPVPCKSRFSHEVLSFYDGTEIREHMKTAVEGVDVQLAHPDELDVRWIGQEEPLRPLLAAW